MTTGRLMLTFLISFASFFVALKSTDPLCEGLDPSEIFSFPHENNCTLYYECIDGQQTLEQCPSGLWFNNKTHSCDFPKLSGCKSQNPRCADVDVDYLPDPEDCTKYIECYHGDSYEMSCPNGYLFHLVHKKCVQADESDCVVSTTPHYTTPHPVCWGVRPNQTVLRPFEGDCTKFWQCTGSQNILQSCPPTLLFDEIRQLCDFPEFVTCGGTTISPNPTTWNPTTPDDGEVDPRCVDSSVAYWPHPALCERYIECYHGRSYEMSCPSGLYFSDESKQCVNPSESECGRTSSSSASSTSGTTSSPRTTSEKPTGWTPDPECADTEDEGKLLPYPGDCEKYYVCDDGEKVAMNCPDGLFFNPSILECDYPYQAGCQQFFFDFLLY